MKRSRIFLATSCLAVALAGAVITKANTFNVTEYYYDNSPTPLCVSTSIPDPGCSTGGTGCTNASHQLYSGIQDQFDCKTPLKKP